MMIKIIIGSKNKGKIREITGIINLPFVKWQTFEEYYDFPDVEEKGRTYEENAILKAKFIAKKYSLPVIADDSGLEVDALKGEPGIFSSRFSGEDSNDQKNIEKLLNLLKDVRKKDRTARFRCYAVMFVLEEGILSAEGVCEGKIGHKSEGDKGFGYDPVFIPEGYSKTMAMFSINEKNKISHRAKAFRKLESKIRAYYL
jgi:XTP/dITP diphosphohydrolase